jgi:hypothetical protein
MKIIFVLFLMSLLLLSSVPLNAEIVYDEDLLEPYWIRWAAPPSHLVLNDLEPIHGVKPLVFVQVDKNNRVGMTSPRIIAEFFGGFVDWDASSGTATITGMGKDGSVEVALQAGATTGIINGETYDIATYSGSAAPGLVSVYTSESNNFYVPIRFLTYAFGYYIHWDGSTTKTIISYYPFSLYSPYIHSTPPTHVILRERTEGYKIVSTEDNTLIGMVSPHILRDYFTIMGYWDAENHVALIRGFKGYDTEVANHASVTLQAGNAICKIDNDYYDIATFTGVGTPNTVMPLIYSSERGSDAENFYVPICLIVEIFELDMEWDAATGTATILIR